MVLIRDYQYLDYEDVKFNLQESGLFIPSWDTQDRLRRKIQNHPSSIIVAEEDKHAVGNVFLTSDSWCAFISHLSVRRDYQNLGIGGMLMDEAERMFKESGVEVVCLLVENNQKTLEDFYKRRAYFPAGDYLALAKQLNHSISVNGIKRSRE